jgi:hypothetical protein
MNPQSQQANGTVHNYVQLSLNHAVVTLDVRWNEWSASRTDLIIPGK